jgi:hypothetical protein
MSRGSAGLRLHGLEDIQQPNAFHLHSTPMNPSHALKNDDIRDRLKRLPDLF